MEELSVQYEMVLEFKQIGLNATYLGIWEGQVYKTLPLKLLVFVKWDDGDKV